MYVRTQRGGGKATNPIRTHPFITLTYALAKNLLHFPAYVLCVQIRNDPHSARRRRRNRRPKEHGYLVVYESFRASFDVANIVKTFVTTSRRNDVVTTS